MIELGPDECLSAEAQRISGLCRSSLQNHRETIVRTAIVGTKKPVLVFSRSAVLTRGAAIKHRAPRVPKTRKSKPPETERTKHLEEQRLARIAEDRAAAADEEWRPLDECCDELGVTDEMVIDAVKAGYVHGVRLPIESEDREWYVHRESAERFFLLGSSSVSGFAPGGLSLDPEATDDEPAFLEAAP